MTIYFVYWLGSSNQWQEKGFATKEKAYSFYNNEIKGKRVNSGIVETEVEE